MKPLRPTPAPSRRAVLAGIAATAAVGALGGCTRVLSEVAGLGTDATVRPDLAYGDHERQRLDLYLPAGAGPRTPLVLFLYGGSWRWGSRGRYGFVGYALASRGVAAAVADYRLYPEARFPDFNYDAARAAAWLKTNRARLGLAAGPLHLMGHSAGAHMAALIALDPKYLGKWGMARGDLGRFVGLSGPYAMHPSRVNYIADIFPPADAEDAARPVAFARADAPPMLLLHGADDEVVAPRNSLTLAELQTARGGAATARLYDGLGHKGMVLALAPPFRGLAPVLDDATAFLEAA